MQGRRSQNLDVIPYNPEIERTIRQPRRPKEDSKEEEEFEVEEKMAEVHVENQADEKFFHSTKPQSTIMHRLPTKCTG
jgi:hypothetical protein